MSPWRPLRHYVLKVASRCDLACDHCYVYEHADQSWRGRPPFMTPATASVAAARIAEHAAAHGLPRVSVILHGGEPLLLGPARLRSLLAELRRTVGAVCELDLGMQTNGVRLDDAYASILLEFGVKAGVSLDGAREHNDLHRIFRRGASSYDPTLRGIAVLRRHPQIYAGLLCTVDLANDPVEVYDALIAQAPPRIDFLLPHATWEHPPPAGSYAAWLLAVHERWTAQGRPVPIRLFDSVRALGRGGPSGTEALGIDAGDVVVIETDGAWEEPDSMKTTWDGAAAIGMTVFDHSADEVTRQPAMARRRGGIGALSATCRACAVVRQCGGGLVAHRYRPGTGFDNPSVYCDDLKELIITLNSQPAPSSEIGSLPAEVFERIAYGFGDAAAVGELASAQLAINRALVAEIVARFGAPSLVASERADPAAFDEMLSRPYVRAWAVRCLTDGFVVLPDFSDKSLDDASPFRDVYGFPVAGALAKEDVAAWEEVLDAAWKVVEIDAPEQLAGLRRGVKTITPLEAAKDGTQRSATSRDAFGALGIAYTPDPEEMAVLLVHEFQHTKLGAVLDLIDLVKEDASGRLDVGWRPDPRPIEAALQGTYAHLGIADIWRRRAERDPSLRPRYAMYRDWTAAAIAALRGGDGLTEAGERFVARMAETVAGWS
ncbi:FxsB family cyclophane-forming radical SAM/SPASM peptide maturase [Actinoplanes sp. CA-142083]|uniref:FxsB family cyclophane-forming radical SAM/SPASM peptide maturase n=1 Tax=Actinoplanes sp. CA-142083 TaxID=3239903 RepID=UPI003D938B08